MALNHQTKTQTANGALNIRCSTNTRTTLEQRLGPPTAIVDIGGGELCLGYRLRVSTENGDVLKKCEEYAARLTGGSLNGRLDRKRCRVISRNPSIEIELDTAPRVLHGAALVKALRAYGDAELKPPTVQPEATQKGNGQGKPSSGTVSDTDTRT